jgi:hypothetical protein
MSETATWPCCDQPYGQGITTCTVDTVTIPGEDRDETFPSVRYDPDYGGPDQRCHDCNVTRGSLHHPGCDMERCPKCEGQLISCGCLSDGAYDAWHREKARADRAEHERDALAEVADRMADAFVKHRTSTHRVEPTSCPTCQEGQSAIDAYRALRTSRGAGSW